MSAKSGNPFFFAQKREMSDLKVSISGNFIKQYVKMLFFLLLGQFLLAIPKK
jgi:hypothetical protein